jgi:hypothetical protein
MRMAIRLAPVSAVTAAGLAVAALAFAWSAAAAKAEQKSEQEMRLPIQIGSALICDTQQQVERFVELYDGDIESALIKVNGEQPEPNACDVATIAYVMGPEVATASVKTGSYRIVRVLVVGAITENGMTAAEPTPLYSVTRAEEREA